MSLIPDKLCAKLGAAMNVSTDIELCAGKKFVRNKDHLWAKKKGKVVSDETKQDFSFEPVQGEQKSLSSWF